MMSGFGGLYMNSMYTVKYMQGSNTHGFGRVPDPPEPPDWEVPTDDIRKCEECEHLKITRINGHDYTGCELWDCEKEGVE